MVTYRDKSTQTHILTIHQAAAIGDINLVKLHVENGIDINDVHKNFTPLYHAISHDNIDVIKYLISNGADLLAHDGKYNHIYLSDIVKYNGYVSIDEYLDDLFGQKM